MTTFRRTHPTSPIPAIPTRVRVKGGAQEDVAAKPLPSLSLEPLTPEPQAPSDYVPAEPADLTPLR
jgi:hypothetical protein